MKRYPAIALIEFSGIADGIRAGDAMIKRAPIVMLRAGTVSRGKYLVLVGGSVASVEEAFAEGVRQAGGKLVDCVILPDVHPRVHDAIQGDRHTCEGESLGVIETGSVAATIRSADAAIKGAAVDIVEIRLADNLGGRAFAIFTGKVEDVESAVRIARETLDERQPLLSETVIPRIDAEMARRIDETTRFSAADIDTIEGGEE